MRYRGVFMFAPAFLLRAPAKPARVHSKPGLACLLVASLAFADGALGQTALEPDEGGVDFKIQGEYAGMVSGAGAMGAQVIALGSGKFKAVFFPGGLPGSLTGPSWNGKDRIEALGTLSDTITVFSGGGFSATLGASGTKFTGKTAKAESFSLDKVMRTSPTAGAPPTAGATVLFDGKNVSAWKDGTASMDARGLFKAEGTTEASGAITKTAYQSFHMHLEFRVPFMPTVSGQGRGNSGIYLQGRDELQILDSFGNTLENGADTMAAKRECGAFWEYFRPLVNAAYPPLSWQTYDIDFTAAQYDAAGKTQLAPATAVVLWNGVLVEDKPALVNATLLGTAAGPAPGPIRVQAYTPVFYRNIWISEGTAAVRPHRPQPLSAGARAQALKDLRLSLISGRQVLPGKRTAFSPYVVSQDPRSDSRPVSGLQPFSGANRAGAISY